MGIHIRVHTIYIYMYTYVGLEFFGYALFTMKLSGAFGEGAHEKQSRYTCGWYVEEFSQ